MRLYQIDMPCLALFLLLLLYEYWEQKLFFLAFQMLFSLPEQFRNLFKIDFRVGTISSFAPNIKFCPGTIFSSLLNIDFHAGTFFLSFPHFDFCTGPSFCSNFIIIL